VTAKKRGAGRPPLAEGTAKGSVIAFRVTDSERAEIDAAAERAGVSLTRWARETLLSAARSPNR